MLDKTYQPHAIEGPVYRAWEDANAFAAGRADRKEARPFAIVIPPPNVTGSLHMGHALNNTLQDVLVRFERMRGRDVLWQPGTDHAGIATQMVVERQLMERQEPNRRALGREKFVERVWQWKEESGNTIVGQLKRLGASCDWSRLRFTMDEGLSRAVRKVFVELYRAGLIYKDKRLVNWDPELLTAISDLEVEQVETKGHLWHLRYPIEGKRFDPSDPSTYIVVATTRPETMLGDTAVAIHPDDPRYQHLIQAKAHAILPLVGRRIPIIADEYSDPEKGSGAVKITPAHDFNDFEVGKRHGLPMINIMGPEGKLELDKPDFIQGVELTPQLKATILEFNGVFRFAARKMLVHQLEADGLVEKIEQHVHSVPHGDRSHAVIEPRLTDQWYVDAASLAKPAIEAVKRGRTTFVPKTWEFDLLPLDGEHSALVRVAAALVGASIPAWYGPDGKVFVAEDETAAAALAKEHYGERVALKRDEDVLDTWFSSALWPFSTLGWPDKTPELARYYPTDVLVTGFDIIFFWVARMMMMGLHVMEEVPFRDVYIHALVRDEKGQKMSKSKGNVIDPLELIDAYGADALRLHAGRYGGARARHQALDLARRGLSQFRDQAVECRAFRRDQWLRARAGLRSGDGTRDGQSLDPRRERAHACRRDRGDREFPFQRSGCRHLPFRLARLLRLVSRADQADPRRRRRRGRRRDARYRCFRTRPGSDRAASLYAFRHRGAVGEARACG